MVKASSTWTQITNDTYVIEGGVPGDAESSKLDPAVLDQRFGQAKDDRAPSREPLSIPLDRDL